MPAGKIFKFVPRKKISANVAKQVVQNRKAIRKLNMANEKYFVRTKLTIPAVNFNGQLDSAFLDTTQGLTDEDDRSGDMLTVKSIAVRGAVQANGEIDYTVGGTVYPLGSSTRMILFWDKKGTVNAPAQVLQETAIDEAPYADIKHDTKREFTIIKDWTISSSVGTNQLKHFAFKKFFNKRVQYENAGEVPINNRLRLLTISNIGVANGNNPSMQMYLNIEYWDA